MRCLEIGPGDQRLPGDWTTVDVMARNGIVDYVCRWGAERLPFPDESFDLIYASHVLEHIPWYETECALREAVRVLAPGGSIEIHVPDFDVLARAAHNQACLDDSAEGGHNDPMHWMHWVAERLFHLGPGEQWHRACFDEEHLKWCLEKVGLTDLHRLTSERGGDHGVINLGISGTKRNPVEYSADLAVIDANADAEPDSADGSGQTVEPVIPGAEGLPPCHSRREYDAASGTFFCAHPQVHIPGQLASGDICRRCNRWQQPKPAVFREYETHAGIKRSGECWFLGNQIGTRQCKSCPGRIHVKVFECIHPAHDSTTITECLRCADYELRLTRGSVVNWAVGVTTAPRTVPTVSRTLESLSSAGWQSPRIFAEPGSPLDAVPRAGIYPVTRRESALGAWPNWFLGLSELYQRNPLADAYLMVQDDVVFCRNVRGYLESALWPSDRVAAISLYYPHPDGAWENGLHFRELSCKDGLPGALAIIFPNLAARMLLSDPLVLIHRRRGSRGLKLIDVVVGTWAHRSRLPVLAAAPSLCQHIGETSTLWPDSPMPINRVSASFPGEDFDALVASKERGLILADCG